MEGPQRSGWKRGIRFRPVLVTDAKDLGIMEKKKSFQTGNNRTGRGILQSVSGFCEGQ